MVLEQTRPSGDAKHKIIIILMDLHLAYNKYGAVNNV